MSVNVLTDSFSVLVQQWQIVLGIVLMVLLSQTLTWSALRMIFRERLTAADYFSLSSAGWILPLSLAAGLWLAWGNLQESTVSTLPLLFLLAIFTIVLLFRSRKKPAQGSNIILWILILLFSVFLFLRFAFVSKVILPLYFDSAQHYLIIKNLLRSLTSDEGALIGWPTGGYYHIGFHLLTAFTSSTLRTDITDTILILGQVIVAAIPLSLFPIISHETHSHRGALFAVLLATVGWYMPAYAVNWGKYPAITSLPLLTFVISLAYLSVRYRDVFSGRRAVWLIGILVLGIVVTGLSHSRSLIALGMITLAWIASAGWERLSKPLRFISFFVVLAAIVLLILFIRTRDVFGLLFDPYWEKGLFITAVVLFLAVFGQWKYPRLTFTSTLVILLLLCALLVPVSVPGYGNLTLLDRPYVEMILYLPLAFLGGAGLAGLEKALQELSARWPAQRFRFAPHLSIVFIGILLVNAFANYNLYPADCCDIVGRDDLVAIDWIDKNLPGGARILISSTELRVLDSTAPQGAAGGDAGAWITPLIDRVTIPMPYQADFSQAAIFDSLCQVGAEYIYVGETGATFNNELLSTHPDQYRVLLALPKTKLYQITGCPGPQ